MCWSRDSPAEPVSQAVLLQPGEVQGGTADTHWQHVEDPSWNRWIPNEGDGPGRTRGPMEKGAPAGKCLPAGLGIPWGIHAGRACSPWKGPTHQREQGMSVRRSSSGEPGVAETRAELTTSPIPVTPALLVKGEVEKIRNEVEPGKKGGVEGWCFKGWVHFLLPYSDFIGTKF